MDRGSVQDRYRAPFAVLKLVACTEPVPSAKKPMAVQWLVTRSTDPMDDSETISASLDASKGVNEGKPIRLLLQYHIQTGKIKAYIQWHELLTFVQRYRKDCLSIPSGASTNGNMANES